jgi:hypothetical protein
MPDQRNIVFVGLVYYRDYLDRFADAYRTMQRDRRFSQTCIVINGDTIDEAAVRNSFGPSRENLHVLKHDNQGQEFGGYQAGLDDHRRRNQDPFDLVLANDTIGKHQQIFDTEFHAFMKTLDGQPSGKVVGKVDTAQRLLSIAPLASSRWIRSNLVGLDHEALEQVRFRVYVPELEALVHETDRESDFFSPALDRSVRDHMQKWLFQPENHSWYGASGLDSRNAARFAAKARSILQELHLSMRLNCEGVAFVPPRLTHHEQRMIRLRRKLLSLGAVIRKPTRNA